MKNIRLLILGHGRHGKDTVAEILNETYGLSFESSSFVAAEKVMMPYFAEQGTPYPSVTECYNDRHTDNNRAVWFDQICAYNEEDPARLAKEIYEKNSIYVGMRNPVEYIATRPLVHHVLWVDRSKHEELEGKDSFNIPRTEDMHFIDNNGNMLALRNSVRAFAESVGLKPALVSQS
jgi:hypothetical protein